MHRARTPVRIHPVLLLLGGVLVQRLPAHERRLEDVDWDKHDGEPGNEAVDEALKEKVHAGGAEFEEARPARK